MSIILLLCLLLSALLLTLTKQRKYGFFTLLMTLVYSIAIGSGLVPALLLKPLQAPFVDLQTPEWKKNNAIVLLGGGTTQLPGSNIYIPSTMIYSRIYKTAELYFSCRKQHACRIIMSGGPIDHTEKSDALVYERALMKLGISQDDFILELKSTDTQTNAEYTQAILQQSPFDQVIIVTSGIHLKRSLLWFSHFNVQAKPVSADYLEPGFGIATLGYNFAITDFALHEYLGILEVYVYNFFDPL